MKRFFALAALVLGTAAQAADGSYLADLQARAQAQKLAANLQWLRLLHYEQNFFGDGVHSSVEQPAFFNAADGRSNPAHELDATLAAFFSDELRLDEPTQCRYKARYEWLKAELGFDAARLPPQDCPRLQAWLKGLDVESAALVFASNNLGSPASMFGHTLLRVNAPAQTGDRALLAYAINYAAYTGPDSGLLYTVRGLTGSYQGYFGLFPYYEKVKEYARIEHRDLWEYPLRLDRAQLQKLLWHGWEMRAAGIDYYFLSDNCSYELLALLETVRPDLDLKSRFRRGPDYTIPIDSVRVLREAGLLGEPLFRAANARRYRHNFEQLDGAQQRWVKHYARGKATLDDAVLTQADARTRARLLESAHDELYFLFLDDAISREEGLPRDRAALIARSRITEPAAFDAVPVPAVTPDQGHNSGRLSAGLRSDGHDGAALLRLRPAYHDRLDPPAGYLAGGEIEAFDARLLARRERLDLDTLRLLSVQQVALRDAVFQPWSWQMSVGARRLGLQTLSADPQGAFGGYIDGGGGAAWAAGAASQLYAFAFGSAEANRDAARGQVLRAGLRAGYALQAPQGLTQQIEIDELGALSPGVRRWRELRYSAQWQWSPTQGLRLNLRHADAVDDSAHSAELLWQWYF